MRFFTTFKTIKIKKNNKNRMTSVPNALTLFRILVIPVVMGFFYLESEIGSWIAAICFLIACITDYLDGYFARTLHQETHLGSFLDPLADKLLIASTLLMLAGFGRIQGLSLIPAVIILCREILVSGLREFLAQTAVSLPVTTLAKWKTTLQMLALGFLILGDPFPEILPLPQFSILALWLSALLTLLTGYDYLFRSFKHIQSYQQKG
jgi:cardiolipin synthase